ncbi:MAG: antibiotic biosynthesis monooxygenase [Acidimicrobiia bacterium]|nr:antibiotic biosynthesis monooxygenase [Acidimicrobiia bacterium]
MDTNHVTVVYKWTAQPGKLDELSAIYADVTKAMEENEPGAQAVHVYRSEADNALYVRDEFADAGAVAFHLSETAAAHFPSLLAIATPGPFFFFGELPDELKQGTQQMGLGAEFSSHLAGFDR